MFKKMINYLFGTPIEMCPKAQRDALIERIANNERTLAMTDVLHLRRLTKGIVKANKVIEELEKRNTLIETNYENTREVLGERIDTLQRELNSNDNEMKKLDGAQALNGIINAISKLTTDYLQVIDPAQRGDDGAMTEGAIQMQEADNRHIRGQNQASVMRVLIDHLEFELANCNLPRVNDLMDKMNSHDIDDGSNDPEEDSYEW